MNDYFIIYDANGNDYAFTPYEHCAAEEAARIGGRYEPYDPEEEE